MTKRLTGREIAKARYAETKKLVRATVTAFPTRSQALAGMLERKPKPTFEIEHGVPLAPQHWGPAPVYPWDDMKPGDSFAVSKPAKAMYNRASQAGKRRGWRFVVRNTGDGECRIWRVA